MKTEWQLFWKLIVFFVAGIFWGFIFCRVVDAQTWDWSPLAPHHEAVCIVRALGPDISEGKEGWFRGSGVIVEYGNLRGVLTAAHAMTGKKIVIQFSDGSKSQVDSKDYTTDKFGHDLAFIFAITPRLIKSITMATEDPVVGDRVEFVTTGGPESRLRSFWATVRSVANDTTEYNCDVLDGDSGGGILNAKGRLIGIQAYGIPPRIAESTSWTAYHGSGSASCRPIRDFLGRIAKSKRCGPRGCPSPGNEQFYPPLSPAGLQQRATPLILPAGAAWRPVTPGDKPFAGKPPKPPNSRTPVPGKSPYVVNFGPPVVDYDKLIEEILARIDMSKLRGPVGPQGKPGSTGAQGRPGSQGQQGPTGPAGATDIDEIADAGKRKIGGSIRIKVTPISPPSKSSL